MSWVTCEISLVTIVTCHNCHMYFFFCISFYGQSGEDYLWRVCFQQCLPSLVFLYLRIFCAIYMKSLLTFSCNSIVLIVSPHPYMWWMSLLGVRNLAFTVSFFVYCIESVQLKPQIKLKKKKVFYIWEWEALLSHLFISSLSKMAIPVLPLRQV